MVSHHRHPRRDVRRGVTLIELMFAIGILLVELGVGVTVAAVVVSIFFLFVDRGRH